MPYNIALTNGTNLVTIADGTTDETTTLTLIGKNFAGYGQFLNENFVQMLENFANSTQPPNPLQGQLWWDTTNAVLKIRNGTLWKSVSGSTASATSPLSPAIGDLWWDTANGQLKSWNGTTWTVIGPAYTATQGQTGVIADAVIGSNDLLSHIIVKIFVNNVLVAVINKDAQFDVNSLIGFTTIYPGFNLATGLGLTYRGDAYNALNLGSVSAANYLRSDIGQTAAGPLTVTSDSGITVGSTCQLSIVTDTAAKLTSTVSGKDIKFISNVGGVLTTSMTVSGTTGNVTVAGDPVLPLGVATKQYIDNTLVGAPYLQRDGTNTITGVIVPATTSLYNFGSGTNKFNTIYANSFDGTATNSTQLNSQPFTSWARRDVDPIFGSNVTITSNQLSIGSGADFKIIVTPSPNVVNLTSFNSKDLVLTAAGNVTVNANPTVALGVATKQYVDSAIVASVPPGTIIDFAGTAAPAGYLQCPLAAGGAQLQLIATYPALFAALGYTWGGAGASFGIPYFAADYTAVQSSANVGTATVGNVLAHTHSATNAVITGGTNNLSQGGPLQFQAGTLTTTSQSPAGGAANLPAGMRVLKCVKY